MSFVYPWCMHLGTDPGCIHCILHELSFLGEVINKLSFTSSVAPCPGAPCLSARLPPLPAQSSCCHHLPLCLLSPILPSVSFLPAICRSDAVCCSLPTSPAMGICTLLKDLLVEGTYFSVEIKCRASCWVLVTTSMLTTSWFCCSHVW